MYAAGGVAADAELSNLLRFRCCALQADSLPVKPVHLAAQAADDLLQQDAGQQQAAAGHGR